MIHGETTHEYRIEGSNLVHIKRFRNDFNDAIVEEREVVINKWAFIMCFEEWILGERRIQLDQEHRREELEREDREWREKLARDLEEIRKNTMKGSADNGKSI